MGSKDTERSPDFEKRAAIIGCGNFSSDNIYSLLSAGAVNELVVLDDDCGSMVDEVAGWLGSCPTSEPARIFQGDFAEAADAGIFIIAASARRVRDETDLEFYRRNIELVRGIGSRLKEEKFRGVILVTTNPVDIMATAVLEGSDLPATHVIGSGRLLDRERFDALVLSAVGGDSGSSAESEDVEDATWCAAKTSDRPTVDFCQPNCPEFGNMLESLGAVPTEITRGKRHPAASGGTCVTRICSAVLKDKHTVLPVCAMASGQHGVSSVFLNLPCTIGRRGVENIIEPRLNPLETGRFRESATALKRAWSILKQKVLTAKTN